MVLFVVTKGKAPVQRTHLSDDAKAPIIVGWVVSCQLYALAALLLLVLAALGLLPFLLLLVVLLGALLL